MPRKSDSTAPAYWIDPHGQVIPVDTNHIEKIVHNPERYGLSRDEVEAAFEFEGEDIGSEGRARERIIVDLIRNGWIRLRYYDRQAMWTANVARLNKAAKDSLYRWAKELLSTSGRSGVKYDLVRIDMPGVQLSASVADIAQDYLYSVEDASFDTKKDYQFFLEAVGRGIDFEKVLESYLHTALWSSTDDDDRPLDEQYTVRSFSHQAVASARRDITAFIKRAGSLLKGVSSEHIGHDFWLTRNRHGAGFWDKADYAGDEGSLFPDTGKNLTAIAQSFGESQAYADDHGLVHLQ